MLAFKIQAWGIVGNYVEWITYSVREAELDCVAMRARGCKAHYEVITADNGPEYGHEGKCNPLVAYSGKPLWLQTLTLECGHRQGMYV